MPGHHQGENGAANQQWEPAAVEQLEHVGGPKSEVDHKEEASRGNAQGQRVVPTVANDVEGENRGDQHIGANRNAIGGRQVTGRLEQHHRQHNRRKQAPIDKRQVNLAGLFDAGVLHLQPRQVAELDHLLGDRKGAGDQRLRGNHRGHGGQYHQRYQGPVRRHQVERVLDGCRVLQQQRALAKIVQRQRRHDDRKPGDPDRLLAKMAHVGVQRLAPGDAQHHRAQDDEGRARVVPHEPQRVMRADGPQNGRIGLDMDQPEQGDAGKPDQGDWPKKLADAAGAAFLHCEQAKQDDQCQRNHIALEGRRHHLQTFHRRQHRDGRGNHAVAVKQAGAKDADHQQHPTQLGFVLDRLRGQRQHGHQPPLTVVVSPQHQQHVLERDDDGQRPEKNRQDAVDVIRGEGHVSGAEHFFDRVQHTGADVAINHADGAQRERSERRFGC